VGGGRVVDVVVGAAIRSVVEVAAGISWPKEKIPTPSTMPARTIIEYPVGRICTRR
jgi:hypothetical protein